MEADRKERRTWAAQRDENGSSMKDASYAAGTVATLLALKRPKFAHFPLCPLFPMSMTHKSAQRVTSGCTL